MLPLRTFVRYLSVESFLITAYTEEVSENYHETIQSMSTEVGYQTDKDQDDNNLRYYAHKQCNQLSPKFCIKMTMAYSTMHACSVYKCQIAPQQIPLPTPLPLLYIHPSNLASQKSLDDPSTTTPKCIPYLLKNMCMNRHMFVVSRSSYRPSYWFQALGLLDTLGFQLRGTARRRDVGAPALSTPVLMTSFVLGIDV